MKITIHTYLKLIVILLFAAILTGALASCTSRADDEQELELEQETELDTDLDPDTETETETEPEQDPDAEPESEQGQGQESALELESEPEPELELEPTPRTFIALGDSVSSGFGLVGYGTNAVPRINGRHTTVLFERLYALDRIDEYINKAVSGYTTTTLLDLLRGLNENSLEDFRNAEIITLNIGGNNILRPFLTYMSDLNPAYGAENMLAGAASLASAWSFIADVLPSDGDEAAAADIVAALVSVRNLMAGLGDLIGGGREMVAAIDGAIAIVSGELSDELETALAGGVLVFFGEFEQIIDWLEVNAPNATIMVNTIYNPIPGMMMGVPIALSNTAGALIDEMNEAIRAAGNARGLIVVDVAPHLENRLDLMNVNLDADADALSFDIIHPNVDGHMLIAELQYSAFMLHSAATQPALRFTDADSPLDVRNALRDFLATPENQDCPVVANFAGFGTGFEHQPIGVLLFDASDEQIHLFRSIIADSPFFFFLSPPTSD